MSQPTLEPRATIDFESRSACSIRLCGSWKYSLNPTTEVLCLAFRLPHWTKGRTALWHPAFPQIDLDEANCADDLAELFRWVIDGGLVEAHNAFFERGIWTNIMTPQFGWPKIRAYQWRCSAAKAAAHSLPRSLEDALAAMNIHDVQKDTVGEKVMKSMAKPRKAKQSDRHARAQRFMPCRTCNATGKFQDLKKDGTPKANLSKCPMCNGTGHKCSDFSALLPMPTLWVETRESFEALFAYCRQDVLAEEGLSNQLPDLNEAETELYLLDQVVNATGFELDPEAVDAALQLIDMAAADINKELAVLTNGEVEKVTQREQMKDWLGEQGLKLFDTRKETLDELLDREDDKDAAPWAQPPAPHVRRALELMRMGGRSSTAKFMAMKHWMCPDNRIHGGLLYHGANTGRWSGSGVQPHNFPKGTAIKQEELWPLLKTLDAARIVTEAPRDKKGEPFYRSLMEALSQGLRGAIVPHPGWQLFVADYAAIEARVLLWVADDTDALDVFRTGADIYCYMADDIYGYKTNKADHPKERGIGKIAVLGLGYQMGAAKFVETCAAGGVTIAEDANCVECDVPSKQHRRVDHHFVAENPDDITAVRIVDAYRSKFWRVKNLWDDQESAAKAAVEYDDVVTQGPVTWVVEDDFLYCELPSGRRLAYPNPEIRETVTSWGATREQLTFMGINPLNRQWQRQHTYGGKLVENIVQAIARDIMAEAMMRCEESGRYVPVLSVHDELIAEGPLTEGSVHEFERLVSECPRWASGLPIAAEGWSGFRYRKA